MKSSQDQIHHVNAIDYPTKEPLGAKSLHSGASLHDHILGTKHVRNAQDTGSVSELQTKLKRQMIL
jgi:hypothetical protein